MNKDVTKKRKYAYILNHKFSLIKIAVAAVAFVIILLAFSVNCC